MCAGADHEYNVYLYYMIFYIDIKI